MVSASKNDWASVGTCVCSACRAWRPDWDVAAARHPQHRWQWLDIEDEPDLMDEVGLDIETFPTVLIARGGQALFLSAIPPQPAFLDHLLARLGRAVGHGQIQRTEVACVALGHRRQVVDLQDIEVVVVVSRQAAADAGGGAVASESPLLPPSFRLLRP